MLNRSLTDGERFVSLTYGHCPFVSTLKEELSRFDLPTVTIKRLKKPESGSHCFPYYQMSGHVDELSQFFFEVIDEEWDSDYNLDDILELFMKTEDPEYRELIEKIRSWKIEIEDSGHRTWKDDALLTSGRV